MLHSDDLIFFQVERRVGVRLLNRSSRKLELTAEGRMLAERGASVLADIDSLADVLTRSTETVYGHLRVAAPFGFGLLPEWSLPTVDIVAVFRSRGGRVKRTRRFVQLLRSAMRQPNWGRPDVAM